MLFLTAQFEREDGNYKKEKFSLKKSCCAASVGAIVSLIPFFVKQDVRLVFLVRCFCFLGGMILMIWIAFERKRWKKRVSILFGNTVLLGGTLTAFPFGKNVIVLVGSAIMATIGFCRFFGRLFYEQKIKQHLCKVKVSFEGIEKEAIGLCDTGNRLKDPYTKKPVIVVEETLMRDYLEVAKLFSPERFVMIPYNSVGGRGILEGVRLTSIKITTKEREYTQYDVVATCGRVDLFSQKPYQIILHTDLFQTLS